MDSKWIQSLFKVYSFIHVIKVSLPDCSCQDCNTVRTKGKYNLILMIGPRLWSNLLGDSGSSISQAMEESAWKPSVYPCTFVLVFHTGMGTDCPTLVRVERNQPAEGGQVERNWVKNFPRWESSRSCGAIVFISSEISSKSFPISGVIGGRSIEKNQLCIVHLDFS